METENEVELGEELIKEIIEDGNKKAIFIKSPKSKMTIKYIYKSRSKNFIFYSCKLENKCQGKGKIDIKKKIYNNN